MGRLGRPDAGTVSRTIQEGKIMSYTVTSQAGKPRPATVTAASALLYLCALVEVVALVLSVLSFSKVSSVLNQEFAGKPEAQIMSTGLIIGLIIGAVIPALFAIGTAVLGVLVGKGKQPARIVTWVLAGISVLCYGCQLGGKALSSSLNGVGGATTPEAEVIQRRLEQAVPAWQTAVATATTVIVLLALVAVIILLALPASNDFFRKEQEVWVPPTWPGHSGLPPVPPPPADPPYGWSGPGGPPAPPAPPQG
jgi:hypothetical protein